MKKAVNELVNEIITIQGNGDYEAANKMINEKSAMPEELKNDLDRIAKANIPKDIVFIQEPTIVGL